VNKISYLKIIIYKFRIYYDSMEEWLSLVSIIVSAVSSAIAIIIAIVLNWWQNKKTNERLEKTLNHEIKLRNERVQKMFDIIKEVFESLKIDTNKRLTLSLIGRTGTQHSYSDPKISVNEEDLYIPIEGDYEEKKALLNFFKDDFKYLWIDEIYVNGFGSFYNNSIKVQGGDFFVCKGFYEAKEDTSEITVEDVLLFILNKLKNDCKEYWGIDLK